MCPLMGSALTIRRERRELYSMTSTLADTCSRDAIGLTGGSGGKMMGKVDYMLRVAEGKNSPRIQETHILVGHVICEIVDQKLFPGV